jgi:hypothetical protein
MDEDSVVEFAGWHAPKPVGRVIELGGRRYAAVPAQFADYAVHESSIVALEIRGDRLYFIRNEADLDRLSEMAIREDFLS